MKSRNNSRQLKKNKNNDAPQPALAPSQCNTDLTREMLNIIQVQLPSIMETQNLILKSLENITQAFQDATLHTASLQQQTFDAVEKISETTATMTCQLRSLSEFGEAKSKSDILQSTCECLKVGISLQWSQNLKTRKKHYWNFVKNKAKSNLYSRWQQTSPQYIPLKYRPKKIPGETLHYTDCRIKEAQLKFTNDISLMIEYSKYHFDKMKEVDNNMMNLISKICSNQEEEEKLLKDWHSDTTREEEISLQVWSRHENFLHQKKHEDELRNCTQLTDATWKEQLDRRYSKIRSSHVTRSSTYQT